MTNQSSAWGTNESIRHTYRALEKVMARVMGGPNMAIGRSTASRDDGFPMALQMELFSFSLP